MHLLIFGLGYTGTALARLAAGTHRTTVVTRQLDAVAPPGVALAPFADPPLGSATHIVATAAGGESVADVCGALFRIIHAGLRACPANAAQTVRVESPVFFTRHDSRNPFRLIEAAFPLPRRVQRNRDNGVKGGFVVAKFYQRRRRGPANEPTAGRAVPQGPLLPLYFRRWIASLQRPRVMSPSPATRRNGGSFPASHFSQTMRAGRIGSPHRSQNGGKIGAICR